MSGHPSASHSNPNFEKFTPHRVLDDSNRLLNVSAHVATLIDDHNDLIEDQRTLERLIVGVDDRLEGLDARVKSLEATVETLLQIIDGLAS